MRLCACDAGLDLSYNVLRTTEGYRLGLFDFFDHIYGGPSEMVPGSYSKNVCDLCGAEAVTTEHDGVLVCNECQRRLEKEEPDFR